MFYLKGLFSAASTHLVPFLFFFFHYRKLFIRNFTLFSYYCRHINVTRNAHALGVTTGQMQFSIHFYSSEFSISLLQITFFSEFELRFLIPRGLVTRKITYKHTYHRTCVDKEYCLQSVKIKTKGTESWM
jgi:hypothetical protein